MKKTILLLTTILSLCCSLKADYILEEALIQDGKLEQLAEDEQCVCYRVVPDENDSFHWPYLLKIDRRIFDKKSSVIMFEMVNSGFASDSFRFLQERAMQTIYWGSKYDEAFKDKFVYMMPMVPRPASIRNFYTHALDRDCFMDQPENYSRIDLQCVAMIEDAIELLSSEFNITVEKKVGIRGFSACGVFAHRFSAIHPDKVKFCISGGFAGMPFLPIKEIDGRKLTYPVGIGDFEELMGKEFDFEAYSQVPRFFHMGERERNDSVDFPDAYDPNEQKLINELLAENPPERWIKTTEILKQFETKNEYYTDEGVGHSYSPKIIEKIEEFITRQLM